MHKDLRTPLLLSAFAMAALSTGLVTGSERLNDLASTAEHAVSSEGNFLVESGVAIRGETFHDILSGSRPARLVSDRLSYTFISSRGDSMRPPDMTVRAVLERQHAVEVASRAKGGVSTQNISVPDDPNPPNGPARPGQATSTFSPCSTARIGFNTSMADVTYHYVYGFTVDTNRDGKLDAVPGWRLDRVEIRIFPSDVAQLCN